MQLNTKTWLLRYKKNFTKKNDNETKDKISKYLNMLLSIA